MNKPKSVGNSRKGRKGAIAALTAVLLVVILGLVACALDIGWLAMTRTQLQAVADASSLAAGTELIDGLGYFKTKTPAEVVDAATPVAVEYAGYNRNAELAASFIEGDRDVEFGKATFDTGCGCWQKTPASEDPAYYNYVAVAPLRNQTGSSNGDRPAPLFFARIFGISEMSMRAAATAAILAGNGFRVVDENDTAPVMPFAFKDSAWDKYLRAEQYYKDHPNVFSQYPKWNTGPSNQQLQTIKDVTGPDPNAPLFGDGSTQQIFDQYRLSEAGVVTSGADSKLELNIYPNNTGSSGNFGTVDLGSGGNSTSELRRKISEGLNANDLSHYENNQITLSVANPLDEGGNPGLSNGVKSALDDVHGQCKAIALYSTLTGNGNNAVFQLVRFVSVAIVFNNQAKEVRVQRCLLVDNSTVPDTEHEIDDETTIFTPLTLIR